MTQENRQEKKKELDSASESKTSLKNIGLPVILLKQSDGKPSVSFTMLIICFSIVMIWLLLSIFEGFGSVKIRQFDFPGVTLFLSSFFALYFGRRWTGLKKEINDKPTEG